MNVVESTGSDTLVFVNINDQKVTCRVHPNEARNPGEDIILMIDMSRVIFFDPVTEKQIV